MTGLFFTLLIALAAILLHRMASPTTPTHGRLAAVYRMRPNGFKGAGLNDVTWGLAAANAATAYYEAVIDGELAGGGGVDTFKWRKNGGAWTENVDITGAAQTLDEDQTITFAATTGHTLDDQWVIGNLVDEACTESGAEAQITDADKRLLNPNATITFTDDGGETVTQIIHAGGKALFTDNVGVVTVAGNNAFIPATGLELVGYLIGWNADFTLDMADISRCGQQWKEQSPGMAGGSGGADAYMIASDTFFDALSDAAAGGEKYFLLQLFNYDPDQDQTGDHFNVWATLDGVSESAPIGDVIKEKMTFKVHGAPYFVANA